MRWGLVLSLVGYMIIVCGMAMIIPTLTDVFVGDVEAAKRFAVSAALTVAVGSLFLLLFPREHTPFRIKEMFLTTTLVWLSYAFFSALPFFLSEYQVSFTDAVFESMSGLTTTGSTILTGLDTLSSGLLLWRSMIQWLGGVGIVIVAIMIFPMLRIGGMQFFNTESSAQSNRDEPAMAKTTRAIFGYFIGLTVLCALALYAAGMSAFDAINHAMTCLATGGFSTHDASIAYFNSPAIEWILTFFMMVGGLPLMMGLYLLQRQWAPIRHNEQIKTYFLFLLGVIVILSLFRWQFDWERWTELGAIIRSSAFNVISIVTTTGYTSGNYQLWGNFAVALFMFLLMAGACTGSTSGGIKMFRFTVMLKSVSIRLKHLLQPYGVFIARYGETPISDDILISVLVFFGLYLGTAVVATLGMTLCGLDFMTGLSGVLTALSNVGPGLGTVIGPDQTFAALPDTAKWILTFVMLLGRLEFVSVIVLFFPFLWRKHA